MICPNCKALINDNSRFCSECGSRIDQSSVKGTIQLKCKNCGGIMDVEPDRPIIFCQFCGTKVLLNESDRVTVQRIKSKTHKEIELEKLGLEKEKLAREDASRRQQEQYNRESEIKQRQEAFRKSPLKTTILVFFALSLLAFARSLSNHNTLMAILTIIQTAVFAIAWLQGMQFIKEKRPNSHLIFAVLGLLLILPILKSCNSSDAASNTPKEESTFEWPQSGICSVLPEPSTNKGELNIYSTALILELEQMSIQDYYNYVEACKVKGFTIDVEQTNTEFGAYNSEGYHLRTYYDYQSTINVDLYNPLRTETIKWPDTQIVKLLPIPISNIGRIGNNNEDHFTVQLTGVSKENTEKYIELCKNAGFNLEQNNGNKTYSAKNADGYKLTVKYEGFNTIYISISAPKQE